MSNEQNNVQKFGLTFAPVIVCEDKRRITPLKESAVKRKKLENRMKSVKCCIFESASNKMSYNKKTAH